MRNRNVQKQLICPKCGGQMKLLEMHSGSGRLICDYCGYETIAVRERTPEEQAAALEVRRQRAQKKAAAAAKRRRRILMIVILAVAAAATITAVGLFRSRRPSVDPFDFVSVSFSGGNGKGEAQLQIQSGGEVDTSKIRYVLSQSFGLSEGDVIRLDAASDDYQLTRKREMITVEGLDTYLSDLDALSEEAIAVIHEKSEAVSLRNRERSADIVHDCLYYEPARMYLLTDEENRNLLYDVYEAGFSMEHDEVYRVYLVTYYENLIVRDTDPVTIEYGRCFYDGNTLQFGESIFHQSTLSGYETLEEIEEVLSSNQDPDMQLKQLDTAPEEEEE